MSDPIPPNLIRSYGDDEPAELTDAARASIESDPRSRAQVRFERTLRERVGQAMSEPVAAMPDGLAGQVRDAIRGADGAAVGVADEASETDSRETGPRSWLAPRRANVFAIAASLALVVGAILFGIFGPSIDKIGPGSDGGSQLVSDTAQYVADEHRRCAAATHTRDGKAEWKTVATARKNLALALGADVATT